jgi:hypothetical protein
MLKIKKKMNSERQNIIHQRIQIRNGKFRYQLLGCQKECKICQPLIKEIE